jgi:hypothetical protein
MERSVIRDSFAACARVPDFAALHPGYGRIEDYFGSKPFSFSASFMFSLKPPGITMSPGF